MKKLFALVLCLMLALGGFAAFAEGETHTIYLITMDLFDAHWVSVDEGCRAAVDELKAQGTNINYVWNAPTQGKDDAAQIECINNAYADNAEVILLASNGPDTQVATLEELHNEGVILVYVDSPANYDGAVQTLATNNKNAGVLAGEQMLAALAEKGVTEGAIGIVNVNAATASTAQPRMRPVSASTPLEMSTATTGMIAQEGNLFRFALGYSIAMTLFICVLTYLQATVWQWMLP